MNKMNNNQLSIKASKSLSSKLWPVIALLSLTTASIAATNENTPYVDSVHQWGPWELGIEPAAGGLNVQTTQAMNARDSKVRLRTNSISALAPPQRPETTIRRHTPLPVTPSAPVTPSLPTITPISPVVPVPIGGPRDGF